MKPQEQTYSKSRRLKNQIKAVVTNPYNIIVLIAVVLLVYLIVLPLLDMIATTFELAQRDIRAVGGGKAGDFTLYYWQRLLASELSWTMLIKPLINSLVIGVCVSVCAILLGSILAWLMVRSDLPFKKFFSLAVIIPYMIPSWCKSQAWLSMFKTARLGGAPGFMASLGLDVPEWLAYGPVAIIIVLTLHYYAYTYLLVSSALNSINSELEEMGEIQGAGKAMILRKITLPLVLPAILSAVILTFSKAIGTFGTINYLGSPVQYYTLSSQLYMNINSRDTQTGFAMAILMIIIASIAVFVNQKLIGSRKSYATIGGKGGRSTLIGLGKVGRPVITAALFVFFAVGIIMPIVILVMESFMLKEGIYSLDNFTLHYWIGESNPQIMEGLPGIFKNDEFINSLFNSLRLTLVNGVFGTIFGSGIADEMMSGAGGGLNMLGIAVGALFTALIQSSSASVGILQALATSGAISFSSSVFILFGQNIGTCITAILSAIGASKNAKRAAMVHLYFNLIGTMLFMAVFYAINAVVHFSFMAQAATPAGIAILHSAFNITATLVLLPFGKSLEKLACLTIRDKK